MCNNKPSSLKSPPPTNLGILLNSLNSKDDYKIYENLKSGQSFKYKTVSRVRGVEDLCNLWARN